MNERILITGGCGFVGSNLAIKLKKEFQGSEVVAMDNLKRRGSELNLARLNEYHVEFIQGDIRNKEDFNDAGEISVLIEAAAEPSVLSGINSSPDYVINTNLFGTVNCLNFAQKHKAKFIFLSTSRVYPISGLNKIIYAESETRFNIDESQGLPGLSAKGIAEDFPLAGARSFYGASKLSSELLIQEYIEFYGLQSVINRCGVLTGPWQMGKVDQGVLVHWLAKHFWKMELSYFGYGGEGKQVRDILHIDDLYLLIKMQLQNFETYSGKTFNVGGGLGVSVSLKELTNMCKSITGNSISVKSVLQNRAADVPIYISDNSKIESLSGWTPTHSAEKILSDTFNWMVENESALKPFLT